MNEPRRALATLIVLIATVRCEDSRPTAFVRFAFGS